MHPNEQALRESYAAFNAGDLPAAGAYLSDDTEWPDQLEGGLLHGREAIQAYWERLGKITQHHYEVVNAIVDDQGTVVTNLLRTVRALDGRVLSHGLIRHAYTFRADGKVARMEMLF
ncbi:MAG TPA: nuclear transport factor 2 family protein [Flavobacteriales bacterium]|nr:nuclear transport factor 2 family protein [Flavobacteriales bacterium]